MARNPRPERIQLRRAHPRDDFLRRSSSRHGYSQGYTIRDQIQTAFGDIFRATYQTSLPPFIESRVSIQRRDDNVTLRQAFENAMHELAEFWYTHICSKTFTWEWSRAFQTSVEATVRTQPRMTWGRLRRRWADVFTRAFHAYQRFQQSFIHPDYATFEQRLDGTMYFTRIQDSLQLVMTQTTLCALNFEQRMRYSFSTGMYQQQDFDTQNEWRVAIPESDSDSDEEIVMMEPRRPVRARPLVDIDHGVALVDFDMSRRRHVQDFNANYQQVQIRQDGISMDQHVANTNRQMQARPIVTTNYETQDQIDDERHPKLRNHVNEFLPITFYFGNNTELATNSEPIVIDEEKKEFTQQMRDQIVDIRSMLQANWQTIVQTDSQRMNQILNHLAAIQLREIQTTVEQLYKLHDQVINMLSKPTVDEISAQALEILESNPPTTPQGRYLGLSDSHYEAIFITLNYFFDPADRYMILNKIGDFMQSSDKTGDDLCTQVVRWIESKGKGEN